VYTRAELIAVRARQIKIRDEDMEEAMLMKTRMRQAGQERFDATHQICQTPLKPKDLVLKHDTFNVNIDKSRLKKLSWRWLGPYVISKAD
jgi:cytidylate kinase